MLCCSERVIDSVFGIRGFIEAPLVLLYVSLSLDNIKAPKWYFSGESKPALFTTSTK